jgi:sec-independent protein translocase protein TatB
MFDIGFSELLVIGVVALIVIGPEKLPRMARTVGHLAGRLQRYVADVKADINREIELEELRKMRDSMQEAASSFETSVQSELNKTETDLNKSVEAVVGDLNTETKSAETKAAESQPATPATPNPSEIGPEPSKKSEQPKPA